VNNNYLDLGTNKSGFVHTHPVAGLRVGAFCNAMVRHECGPQILSRLQKPDVLFSMPRVAPIHCHHVPLHYQPPLNITFLLKQISYQQLVIVFFF
jgi:hypothetical protein